MTGSSAAPDMDEVLKRNSNDVAWEYGRLCNRNNPDKVKCNLCDNGDEDDEADVELEELRSKKMPRRLGPMEKFASDINPRSSSLPTRQQNISDALWKERLHKFHQYVSRWAYVSGVPFHATAGDEFKLMLEAAGQFGPGVTPPSQYKLRDPLLKDQEEEWKENGCSVMTDGWSDGKRSIMNLCINCRGGTIFLSSKECSDDAHTGEYICGSSGNR